MDNRHINCCLESKEDFDIVMKLACKHKTIGYLVKDNSLILYYADHPGINKFPYEMGLNEIIVFVWGWLQSVRPSKKEPDHDGDNHKGFRVYNDAWGQVCGWQSFIAIEPIWAMYGK